MTIDEFRRLRRSDAESVSYAQFVAVANELATSSPGATGLPELKVAILRNITVETLVPALAGEILAAGYFPTFYIGDFGALELEAMNPTSGLHAFSPDLVLIVNWLDAASPALARRFVGMTSDEVGREVDRVVAQIDSVVGSISERSKATILVNNFPQGPAPTLGILDAQSPDLAIGTLLAMNERLRSAVRRHAGAFVVDFCRLFGSLGSQALDERYWQIARAPIATKALLPLAREYGRFVRAIRGGAKKCLVVDCDNTLWGGTIGEDGLAGIKIGTTYPGSCFLSLQEEILNLHDRGVILAICSKNDEAEVLGVFRDHPEMLLRERHFATMQINWDDKVTNLRRIAEDLNIGLDSLVFLDDSAFETGFVRDQLPEVDVIRLPEGAYATYRRLLTEPGYFDSLSFTDEDRRKNEMYAEERDRKELRSGASSLEEYLQKLEIRVDIGRARAIDVPRIVQLTQKTNQFNLTTRRYSEAEIEAFAGAEDADVFYATVGDNVADLGLVGAAVLARSGGRASVEALLFSCRSLGRGAEDALLAALVDRAAERGCSRVVGTYSPTAKNGMVADFYARHGFRRVTGAEGRVVWEHEIGIDAPIAVPTWITLTNLETTHAD